MNKFELTQTCLNKDQFVDFKLKMGMGREWFEILSFFLGGGGGGGEWGRI